MEEKVIELINEYRFTKLGEGIDIYLEIEEGYEYDRNFQYRTEN